jgi:hypothetical protein
MQLNIRVAASAAIVALMADAAHADMFSSIERSIAEATQSIAETTRSIAESRAGIDKAIKSMTTPQQQMLDKLKTLSVDQLYRLKVSDGCQAGIVQCGSLKTGDLQQLADVELARRTADEAAANQEATALDRNRNFYISVGSLVVSAFALVFSVFSTFRKGGNPAET